MAYYCINVALFEDVFGASSLHCIEVAQYYYYFNVALAYYCFDVALPEDSTLLALRRRQDEVFHDPCGG